jgi:hypothetical protein
MSPRFATAVVAICISTVWAQGDCMWGFGQMGRFDENCPKACSNGGDQSNQLPSCGKGEPERNPKSCGETVAPACALLIKDFKAEEVIKALATCEGTMKESAAMIDRPFLDYSHWSVASECDHKADVKIDTCPGAVLTTKGAEACSSCNNDQTKAQLKKCQDYLLQVKYRKDDLAKGIASCKEASGLLAGLKDVANDAASGTQLEESARIMASGCDFNYDALEYPENPTCKPVPYRKYQEMRDMGIRLKPCSAT